MGYGGNHHHPWENQDSSTTKHLVDLRPVCKLEFGSCAQEEKNKTLYLCWFIRGSLTKFEITNFLIVKSRFSQNFAKIPEFSTQC